eukprot:1300974-Amphidinium_carterae.1
MGGLLIQGKRSHDNGVPWSEETDRFDRTGRSYAFGGLQVCCQLNIFSLVFWGASMSSAVVNQSHDIVVM